MRRVNSQDEVSLHERHAKSKRLTDAVEERPDHRAADRLYRREEACQASVGAVRRRLVFGGVAVSPDERADEVGLHRSLELIGQGVEDYVHIGDGHFGHRHGCLAGLTTVTKRTC